MEHPQKFIAFLDILGFKDLVTNNSHNDLMRKIDLLLPVIEMALSHGNRKTIEKNGKTTEIADIEHIKIHSLSISDSIMFWTDDCSLGSFMQITLVVRHMLEGGFYIGLPLRGAISIGNLSFLNLSFGEKTNNFHSLLMGKGLVEAYKMESKQEWSGCVIDESCINKVVELNPDMAISDDWFLSPKLIIKYDVPYKSGIVKREYVIRWIKEPQNINENSLRSNFSAHKKNSDNSSAELKIQNTMKFIEYCKALDEKENTPS